MNNQRNNNNRRRGRGNNRGGGGGGNPVNRIDSRARGNAPQMLEKYRKLAHEASLNDDRVQTEYYLQFADHYFRVIADAKAQKDEQQGQGRPRNEREAADDGDDYFEDDRFGDRRPQQQRPDRAPQGDDEEAEMQRGTEGEPVEDEANPFLAPRQPRREREGRDRDGRDRDGRDNRESRNRNERRPRREERDGNRDGNRADTAEEAAPTFDPGMLPPSISRASSDDEPAVPVETADAAPAPKPRRTRTPRKKSEGDGGGEALEAIG